MKGNSLFTSVTHRVRMRESFHPQSSYQRHFPVPVLLGDFLITLMFVKSHSRPKKWSLKFEDAFFFFFSSCSQK